MFKKLILITITTNLLGCDLPPVPIKPIKPTEEQINLAEEEYNKDYITNYDKEGCWPVKKSTRAAYVDGKLDPSFATLTETDATTDATTRSYQSVSANIYTENSEVCVDDLVKEIDNINVQENETILFKVSAELGSNWRNPDVLLFSTDEDNPNKGCFRNIKIESFLSWSIPRLWINGPSSCNRWSEAYGKKNKASYSYERVVWSNRRNKGFKIPLQIWLDRENLVYGMEFQATYESEPYTYDSRYLIIDKQELRNRLKKRLMDIHQFEKVEKEKEKSREQEKLKKRKI